MKVGPRMELKWSPVFVGFFYRDWRHDRVFIDFTFACSQHENKLFSRVKIESSGLKFAPL